MIRVHLRVRGRVQGVFFRGSAQAEAARLGLRGWVRNRSDGSVELVAEGEAAAMEGLLDWCRRGPSGAQVTGVEEVREEPVGLDEGFDVRPSL